MKNIVGLPLNEMNGVYCFNMSGTVIAVCEEKRSHNLSKEDADKIMVLARKIANKKYKFAYRYGVYVKHSCGCWEFLQTPDFNGIENETKIRCSKCR